MITFSKNAENGLRAYDEVNENGYVTDDYHIYYLRDHIEVIGRALEDGVDVTEYTPW